MPANTPRGLPYPLPTEPVAEGAQAIRNLAEAVDPKLGGELAYAELTTNKTVTATNETSADLVVASPAITLDGTTAVYIECYSAGVYTPNIVGAFIALILYQDGASIGRLGTFHAWAAQQYASSFFAKRKLTPAAGSRYWSFAAITSGGSGIVSAGAGGSGQTMPAFIRIVRA